MNAARGLAAGVTCAPIISAALPALGWAGRALHQLARKAHR